MIRFQWDPRKGTQNERKHAVSFSEAATVFRDPNAQLFDDDDHSQVEHREIIIGYSDRNRLLVVSFVERDDVIRVISARKVDRGEHENYEKASR
jgi:uncharacterized DUF497 family protein